MQHMAQQRDRACGETHKIIPYSVLGKTVMKQTLLRQFALSTADKVFSLSGSTLSCYTVHKASELSYREMADRQP